MFARRSFAAVPAQPVDTGSSLPVWLTQLTNPYVGAGAAAGLMAVAAGALILFAGDPHAGAPSVRLALAAPTPKDLGALRPAPSAPVLLDSLQPGQEALVPDGAQAQITLPQGGSVSGGSSALSLTPTTPGVAPADAAPPRPQSPPLPIAPITGLSAPGSHRPPAPSSPMTAARQRRPMPAPSTTPESPAWRSSSAVWA